MTELLSPEQCRPRMSKPRPPHRRVLLCVLLSMQAICGLWADRTARAQLPSPSGQSSPAPVFDIWQQDLLRWRAARAKEVDAPDGWLTLVGLEWLNAGSNTVGSATDNLVHLPAPAPDHLAVLNVTGNTVSLAAPAAGFPADLQLDGKPASAGPLTVEGTKPSVLTWRSMTFLVLNRGGRYTLRIKDSDSPARAAFHGLNWYPPDKHFRVEARWIPYTPPHIEKIPTVIGTVLELPSPGVAEFTLDGKTIRLEPVIEASEHNTLFFILRDQTRYDSTYEAARFLHTGLPDHGLDRPGTLSLDFNKLENPPCAYTPFATCPLPPESNRLLIQLQAGEKRYLSTAQ
jgi:uncharacterized protein (DUF1684 family)